MEIFQKWYEDRHQYAKEWKQRTGGKVMGYFCTYVPEEILYAANILPVRILGSHEPQDVTEPHIFGMYCPFCRDTLAQGLKGHYDYLDGIMIAQSCLHIRQSYTSWDLHVKKEGQFSYYLPMPHHVQSERSRPFLRDEYDLFVKAVQDWTGQVITDADLQRGIDTMNTNRRLLRELYESRKQEEVPFTGLEAMYAVISSQLTDKNEHNQALESALKTLPERTGKRATGERLMIIGSEDDDTAFIDMVENVLDATFVIDDHCTGSRYFWNQVESQEDLLAAIASRYIDRPPCPTKDWPQRKRLDHALKLAKDWDVKGVIMVQQKFCDPHELDTPAFQKAFQAIGIPTLFLEFDVTVPLGPFRIRVEAFLETLRQDDLF